MNKRYLLLPGFLALTMLAGCGSTGTTAPAASATEMMPASETATSKATASAPAVTPEDVTLEKSAYGNPIIRLTDEKGDRIYGGDPAVYVDGDTAYLYTGHDMSTDVEVSEAAYHIPEYFCYSSKDLLTWTPEGVVMNMRDVSWAKDHISAWASQVTKHTDPATGKELYYLYFCSWDKTGGGKQSIGVAVAESPTGPFTDIGEPLVMGVITKPQTSAWNDIDPTVFVDTDKNGEEHRYLAWGNAIFYICELNPDMISVKDQNGDGKITCGHNLDDADIMSNNKGLLSYTEAPWLYRRTDADGSYTGDYYLFYASEWRESMAYSTTTDLRSGVWENSQIFMLPTATCNTNHEAIFDFQGKTYMMYHDGALPGGNGYRRSACLQELVWNEDGTISMMEESASGLTGTISSITAADGTPLSHAHFDNSSSDDAYPYTDIAVGTGLSDEEKDAQWVIVAGKSDEDDPALVSIQAENKTGLFLTVKDDGSVTLSQDIDGKEETAAAQTFRSVTGLNGDPDAVSFQSVTDPAKYLTIVDGILTLTDGADAESASFVVRSETAAFAVSVFLQR